MAQVQRMTKVAVMAVVVAALALLASCGSSGPSGSGSSSTDSSGSKSSTTKAPATERDLRKALLNQGDVGAGYTQINQTSSSQQSSDSSSPDLSKLDAPPECKLLLASLSRRAKTSDKTTASVVFRKADMTKLEEGLVTVAGLEQTFTQGQQAIAGCKLLNTSGPAGSLSLVVAPFDVPKLADGSYGAKLTVTVNLQGQTSTGDSYVGFVRRGEVEETVQLADHTSTTGPPVMADPAALAGLMQKADAKLAAQR